MDAVWMAGEKGGVGGNRKMIGLGDGSAKGLQKARVDAMAA